jgi:hypothetical protein
MIKVEHIETWGFEHAIRGMRNPLNSWNKSDSGYCEDVQFCSNCIVCDDNTYIVGKNDLELMKKLAKAGHPHRKYLRQIFVSMDVTAPLYWWKEFDTYKVGTVANSCSTMHKIHSKEFTLDDFSHEHLHKDFGLLMLGKIIADLNRYRNIYNNGFKPVPGDGEEIEPGSKVIWWQMIQLLPSSYNQKRTITFNYENALNIIQYRTNHKLDEWCVFVEVLKTLPYAKELF